MASISDEGGSPYNLRKKIPHKGPSPRAPIRKKDEKVNNYDSSSAEEERESTSPLKESPSPGVVDVSKSSKGGSLSPQKSRKTRSPAGSPQSDKGFSSNSSFEQSPSPVRRSNTKQSRSAQKTSTGSSQAQSQSSMFINALGIVVVVVLACILYHYVPYAPISNEDPFKGNLDPDENTRISFEHFQDKFMEFKMKFPGQDRNFWRTVFGMLRPMIVEPNPAAPAVLMMVVPENQHGESPTAECLARQLLTLYSGLFNRSLGSQESCIHIKNDLKHESAAKDKKELDKKLQYVFGQSAGKGVILDNFESLSPFAALLLHGYCDGDNAPYKDVLFIQIVHTNKQAEELTSQKNFMDKYLTDLWISDLDEDKIQPLLTRIANNVAMVTPENEQTLSQNC
ncbi:torsin-1A-interacting protein 2-like [Mizuhopecten yessoensis]|uniref:torsin-1A-interacting protein 2-like n=1 Tax=Mizuhopecten yessoensis TaxID=6573 RepID=UPI000B45788A|nr:torsin-1A-interacting protein 2-like [Mizuhopecten yessoensis]XP_021362378.1 torsin-1A-interacting protein 2-like [Mizuhopecten yessoensis]XP_021362379.1 torsin-1A-interacting protein 2-like [Mizuhopecten yessoensis]